MSDDWQTKVDTLVGKAEYILKNGLWTDCTFEVGVDNKKMVFKAHKLILSMASPVFDKMFLHDGLSETNNKHVQIVDIQPEAFSLLLKYIYTERLEINSFDQACELCYIANKYLMPTLVQKCSVYIWKDVNVSNVCRCYEFAKLFNQISLMEKCKQIICASASKLISNDSLIDIEKDTLLMILDQDELNIESELNLFEAAVKWIKARFDKNDIDVEVKENVCNEIISKIRFLSMTPSEFAECLALSDLIDKDKRLTIFLLISSKNPNYAVPEGISDKKNMRCKPIHIEEYTISWCMESPQEIYIDEPIFKHCFLLTCNENINLLAVQVNGVVLCDEAEGLTKFFSDPMEFDVSGSEEGMQAFIDDIEGDIHKHSITRSSDGTYEEIIKIFFKNGVPIKAGVNYRIGIKILRPGLYIGREFITGTITLVENDIKFNISNEDTCWISFISGLIYTLNKT